MTVAVCQLLVIHVKSITAKINLMAFVCFFCHWLIVPVTASGLNRLAANTAQIDFKHLIGVWAAQNSISVGESALVQIGKQSKLHVFIVKWKWNMWAVISFCRLWKIRICFQLKKIFSECLIVRILLASVAIRDLKRIQVRYWIWVGLKSNSFDKQKAV